MATHGIFPPPSTAHNSHKDCFECDQHFYSVQDQQETGLRYQGSISKTDAQSRLTKLVTSTKRDLDRLQEHLRSHGDLILTRWNKWSLNKRGEALSKSSRELFGPWPRPPAPKPDPNGRMPSGYS